MKGYSIISLFDCFGIAIDKRKPTEVTHRDTGALVIGVPFELGGCLGMAITSQRRKAQGCGARDSEEWFIHRFKIVYFE